MKARFHGWNWLVLVSLSVSLNAFAETSSYVDGQIIVRLKGNASTQGLKASSAAAVIQETTSLVPELNLWLVKLTKKTTVPHAVQILGQQQDVLYAQPDHLISLREADEVIPNEPRFGELWSLVNRSNRADISATQAWKLGTGGRDRDGNDIVVAVVDGGVDLTHPDLASNIWTNSGEIPGNGIDDDGNGYVDDVNGWNAFSNNGTIPSASHGTHVAGIIGARGNNGAHVAGVNWNVKIMAVAGASGTTSVVAAAYGYVLKQKQLWLDSNHTKGANVVATNSSFGVDYANCASGSFPVWNDLYDAMGKVGILSAAATANNNVDVDVRGDVPTACSSPYIVAVTNTTNQDRKYTQAGYGAINVDLGAPGTAIISTVPNSGTQAMTGTSMATPHVAGAIAFLHSVASENFNRMTRQDPGTAALALKEAILQSVDPIAELNGVTVSGGRLNLNRSAQAMSLFTRQ